MQSETPKYNFKQSIRSNSSLVSFFIFLLFLGGFFAIALPAFAALVPCSGIDCNVCHFYEGIRNIMNFLLRVAVLPLLVISLLAAGMLYLISGGSEKFRTMAKDILWYAIIGLLVAFAAWVIVNTLLDTLGFKIPFGPSDWTNTKICEQFDKLRASGTPDSGGSGDSDRGSGNGNGSSGNCPDCVTLSVPSKPGACKPPGPCKVHKNLNDKLVNLNRDIIREGKLSFWRVTEAWPQTVVHQNQCHTQGTCVDANLIGGHAGNSSDITYFIQKAKGAGLRPVYEVGNDLDRQRFIDQGVPSGNIQTVPGINGNHFSLYNI